MSQTETKSAPSASVMSALVNNFVPATPTPAAVVKAKGWTLGMIDRIEGGKGNRIVVVSITNPKQPGSDAAILFPLQGRPGEGNVTVAQFLAIGAETKGKKGPMGRARVVADLKWNLDKGFVRVMDAKGNEITKDMVS